MSEHTVIENAPVDGWVELRVGGDRVTRVSVAAGESVTVEVEADD